MSEIVQSNPNLSRITAMVTSGLSSKHSIAAYRRNIEDYLEWQASQELPFVKASVQQYRMHMMREGQGAASINQALSAIRALAREASDNALIDHQIASGIMNVKGVRKEGSEIGFWLSKEEVKKLLSLPDDSAKGHRDRALLSVMISSGLRRAEVAHLQWKNVSSREGRPILVDIVGKRNKTRSVPIPVWTDAYLDVWHSRDVARQSEPWVFCGLYKSGSFRSAPITPQGIWSVVKNYAEMMGLDFAPHDLRRTFAQLAYKGGSPLKQISLSLGHNSVKTTEVYLGVEQDLQDAPADHLGLYEPHE